jgi:hypothetical protein
VEHIVLRCLYTFGMKTPLGWQLCVEKVAVNISWIVYLRVQLLKDMLNLFLNPNTSKSVIKFATHKYRSTDVNDVSITNLFSAFNCAVFKSSVYVCYMWQWVVWRVYWLCWMETGQMWISILWTLCGLFNLDLLCYYSVRRIDTKNRSRLHNDSLPYDGYTIG